MADENSYGGSRDTLPMSVANMTFLVNRLGEDCSPLQFVRELTQNAIEAVAMTREDGSVIWDVDWAYANLTDGVFKLACIDTGIGMTGIEMVKHINALSSSIHQQSQSGNFGVGAKIAAAPRNPIGLVYMSWKNGIGHMIHLWFDPIEKVYGLKRWPRNNGEFWTPVSDEAKPKDIHDHGTMVVLLGRSDNENTIEPPPGAPMRSRWILRYLNTRYFRFPKGVHVRAREGWDLPRTDSRHNFLRTVEGQGVWLDKNAESLGRVSLSEATAHWWILKEEIDRNSGHIAPGGHAAALFQNELYEMAVGRSGLARLQAFGVIFGTDRVVIYVEPNANDALSANTARTQLMLSGEALDWQAWAAEFREKMPEQIRALQESIGSKVDEQDHKKAILERLKQIRELLRFSRFKPSSSGTQVCGEEVEPYEVERTKKQAIKKSEEKKNGAKKVPDIYSLYAEAGPQAGYPVDSFFEPRTKWISVAKGTRIPPDLDDRAAKYLTQQNLLLINADFRVFSDMVDRWAKFYEGIAVSRETISLTVHEWFEQHLVEAVMSAQALKNTGRWSIQEIEELWSEFSLTTAVLPRWHIDQSIKRSLGIRLGSLKGT